MNVNRPRFGRMPARSSRSSAIAPQTSLPWRIAVSTISGPGSDAVKLNTYGMPVLLERYRSSEGRVTVAAERVAEGMDQAYSNRRVCPGENERVRIEIVP